MENLNYKRNWNIYSKCNYHEMMDEDDTHGKTRLDEFMEAQ